MFTGIVEEVGTVAEAAVPELRVAAKTVLEGTKVGDSIAVNGVCLTVTGVDGGHFTDDVVPETMRRSNLGRLSPGDPVNLERPLVYGGRVGGHLVQGHVDGTGRITEATPDGDAFMVRFQAPATVLDYVVEKGFITVDGVSLTVVACASDWFSVTLIPFTRENSILGTKGVGDEVNLEVDMMAKYAEKLLHGPRDG